MNNTKEVIMNLYTIYDKIAEESGPIFSAVNDGIALRSYKNLVEKEGISINEFDLVHVAQYDHRTMRLDPCDPRILSVIISTDERGHSVLTISGKDQNTET